MLQWECKKWALRGGREIERCGATHMQAGKKPENRVHATTVRIGRVVFSCDSFDFLLVYNLSNVHSLRSHEVLEVRALSYGCEIQQPPCDLQRADLGVQIKQLQSAAAYVRFIGQPHEQQHGVSSARHALNHR